MHQAERRQKRSDDPMVALHYQLAQARAGADVDAIVVADASGIAIAASGSWAACEELAAYAPLLGDAGAHGLSVAPRMQALREKTETTRVVALDQELFVCARGGLGKGLALQTAAFGVARILRAA
jgi:hypothetical protein